MYFQNLMNIKKKRYDNDEINKLDKWLINLSNKQTKYLNPLQFAYDSNLRSDIAMKVFDEAVRVETLKVFYQVMDVDRVETIDIYYSRKEIPKKIYSNILKEEIDVCSETVLVWFRLIEKPTKQPPSIQEEIKKELPPRKKIRPLKLDDILTNRLLDEEEKS